LSQSVDRPPDVSRSDGHSATPTDGDGSPERDRAAATEGGLDPGPVPGPPPDTTDGRTGPRTTALALVASNLVPLVGVVALGWNLLALLVLYWVESGIVGASYAARILRSEGEDDPAELPSMSFNDRSVASFVGESNAAIARFFMGHYGFFWAVHGLFVGGFGVTIFAGPDGPVVPNPLTLAFGVVALVASHAYSYRINFVGEREYERVGPVRLMVDPYRRVIVLHLTIIFGAFAVNFVGAPVGALIVMVVVKTAIDLYAHWREHETAQTRAPATTVDRA
jgi:hypothetical protein